MNEVAELTKLEIDKLDSQTGMLLDDLHKNALKNMYLELGEGSILYLLSPSYSVINPSPNAVITDFTSTCENTLDAVKEYIIHNLAEYSVLIDVNSYFVEQNQSMILARLRERDTGGRQYEVKFYTHSPRELISNYQDKIYIGRDFIDLYQFRRKHFGVKEYIESLKTQYDMLIDKAEEKMKKPLKYKSFFQEIKESINELHEESLQILEANPKYIEFDDISGKDLIDINAQYRTINHYLIELYDDVSEFENLLRFKMESDFVRHVTKFKKDLSNLISYFNIKVNGCLAEKIRSRRNHG
ncbi:MAG: hypothetical protein ABIK95_08400 [Acidobacteriota bacterium]